jgi:hypothetical protein
MLLEVQKMLPQEGPVRLHFYLPGDPRPLQILAEVLRAEFVGAMSKYGVRFLEPTDDDRDRISRYVYRLRSRETI